MPPPVGIIKLNFNVSLDKPIQLGTRGMNIDHHETLVTALSRNSRVGLAIKAKVLTLLEDLKLAKANSLFTLLDEGVSNSPISDKLEGEKLVEV